MAREITAILARDARDQGPLYRFVFSWHGWVYVCQWANVSIHHWSQNSNEGLSSLHMVTEDILKQVHDLFEQYLGQNGHRKTPERFAILREVYQFDGHFDIEALYAHMKRHKYRVSRATLYNTIELLLDCNLVRKHQFGDKVAQYERSHRIKQHDHIILADTGEVIEFCDPRVQQIKATVESLFGIEVLHHSLNLYARRQGTKSNGNSD